MGPDNSAMVINTFWYPWVILHWWWRDFCIFLNNCVWIWYQHWHFMWFGGHQFLRPEIFINPSIVAVHKEHRIDLLSLLICFLKHFLIKTLPKNIIYQMIRFMREQVTWRQRKSQRKYYQPESQEVWVIFGFEASNFPFGHRFSSCYQLTLFWGEWKSEQYQQQFFVVVLVFTGNSSPHLLKEPCL